jgi:hypothetical protein
MAEPSHSQLNWDQPTHTAHGRRPTRILLGCWNRSSEANPQNRHAVFGVLGTNDTFRVKLVRHTRDGRYLDGNFPPGPGALWIQYNEVDFDPHLRNLNRDEVKEYCRIRQRQIDSGEHEDDRIDNETKAVYEAQQRVARQTAFGTTVSLIDNTTSSSPFMNTPRPGDGVNVAMRLAASANDPHGATSSVTDLVSRRFDPRPARHSLSGAPGEVYPRAGHHHASQPVRNALPPIQQQQQQQQHPRAVPDEVADRTGEIVRREVTRLGAVQNRNEQRQAHRDVATVAAHAAAQEAVAAITMSQQQQHHQHPHHHLTPQQAPSHQQSNFGALQPLQTNQASPTYGGGGQFSESDNVQALQKIWQQKEAQRLKYVGGGAASGVLGAGHYANGAAYTGGSGSGGPLNAGGAGQATTSGDAKFYGGVQYDRKASGPFAGRLISQGTIINIDGEDYVEYRVLTKPSFF